MKIRGLKRWPSRACRCPRMRKRISHFGMKNYPQSNHRKCKEGEAETLVSEARHAARTTMVR